MSARPLVALGLALAMAACLDNDPVRPAAETGPGGIFTTYVSMGGTATAGYQSGGINDSTQALAYPALLADKVGARFERPSIRMPGCPPPLRDPFSGTTIDDEVACSLRKRPLPHVINNVAVPGAGVYDASSNDGPRSRPGLTTTLILGGRTQIEAMADARPTLVSVWYGNADVQLGGILGVPEALLPLDEFATAYDSVLSAIRAQQPVDVVLLGIVPGSRSPAVQPAPYFWAHQESGYSVNVDANCSPGSPFADNDVSLVALLDASLGTISCDDDAPYVHSVAERDAMREHVDALNAFIAARAAENGWLYLDVDSVFSEHYSDPVKFRKCQGFATAQTPDDYIDAFVESCPAPGKSDLYGTFVSFDSINPATPYHDALAEALFDLLSTRYTLRR